MEEKIKEILSVFLKIPAEQITNDTLMDRSAINNSILVHRLYAKLASEGIVIENHWDIKDFAELKKRINANKYSMDNIVSHEINNENTVTYSNLSHAGSPEGIGIDIEETDAMPRVDDIREDEFYKMNFASSEIAYCILQKDSYASLAGLFAAKEAIIKADNRYKNRAFNSIIIDHMPDGKPFCKEFHLSISHTQSIAVAVAVLYSTGQAKFIQKEDTFVSRSILTNKHVIVMLLLLLLALSLSVFAVVLVLKA